MLLLFPTKVALPLCAQGFMPKHGSFTTIGKYLGTKVHNLSEKTKKKAEIFRFPPSEYFIERLPKRPNDLFTSTVSCRYFLPVLAFAEWQ